MIDKRLMYYRGGAAQDSGNAENQAASAAAAGSSGAPGPGDTGGEGGNNPSDNSDTQTTNTTTNNDSDFDPFGHSRFDVGSGYYGEPVTSDPDETTIDETTTAFAPPDKKPGGFLEGIKTIGKKLFKGYVAIQTFGALGLSPKAVQIANVALGLGKQTGLTKSGSISELGLNAVTGIADLFSGNKNTGINTNSFSGNTNSFSGNTNSLSDTNQNNGGEGGNNDVLSSEYILLLQKMQLGNFTQEDQTRFNLLKTMLGK